MRNAPMWACSVAALTLTFVSCALFGTEISGNVTLHHHISGVRGEIDSGDMCWGKNNDPFSNAADADSLVGNAVLKVADRETRKVLGTADWEDGLVKSNSTGLVREGAGSFNVYCTVDFTLRSSNNPNRFIFSVDGYEGHEVLWYNEWNDEGRPRLLFGFGRTIHLSGAQAPSENEPLPSGQAFEFNESGMAHFDNGEYQRAIEDFNSAIAQDPDYSSAYNNRGNAYYKLTNYQRAIEDYDRAIAIDPGKAKAYLGRANSYHDLTEFHKAIEDYSRAIRYAPDSTVSAASYNDRGVAYYALRQYENALADFEQVIALDPTHDSAHANRAGILEILGR